MQIVPHNTYRSGEPQHPREFVASKAELESLALELQAAQRIVVALGTGVAAGSGATALRFVWRSTSGVVRDATVDLSQFESFSGRGYIGRVRNLTAPLAPLFRSPETVKIVYEQTEKRALKLFAEKFIGEVSGIIALEDSIPSVRPDLPSTSFTLALFALLGRSGLPSAEEDRPRALAQMAEVVAERISRVTPQKLPLEQICSTILSREERRCSRARESGLVQQYWTLKWSAQLARDQIISLLRARAGESGVVVEEHQFGSLRYECKKQREIDANLARERHAELSPLLEARVTKERILAAFRAQGLTRQQAEGVIENLYIEAGTGSPRVDIAPAYQSLYRNLPGPVVHPSWRIHPMVRSRAALERLARRLERIESFSVDTETWGPPGEPPDRDLCLIQIGIRGEDGELGEVYLVQVKQLEAELSHQGGGNPLQPLRAVLESEQVLKVAHHKQFEEAQFRKYGIELRAALDTKEIVKAFRPDLHSYTLRACCFEVLGVVLSKEQQLSDWNRDTLTAEQIQYAALDAEYTLRLFDAIREIRSGITIPEHGSFDELLWRLIDAECSALRVANAIGLDTWYWSEGVANELLIESVSESLKAELSRDPARGEIRFQNECGSISCTRPRLRELDRTKLSREHPAIAELATEYHLREEQVRRFLTEKGWREEELTAELHRLSKDSGERVTIKIQPRFELGFQR